MINEHFISVFTSSKQSNTTKFFLYLFLLVFIICKTLFKKQIQTYRLQEQKDGSARVKCLYKETSKDFLYMVLSDFVP